MESDNEANRVIHCHKEHESIFVIWPPIGISMCILFAGSVYSKALAIQCRENHPEWEHNFWQRQCRLCWIVYQIGRSRSAIGLPTYLLGCGLKQGNSGPEAVSAQPLPKCADTAIFWGVLWNGQVMCLRTGLHKLQSQEYLLLEDGDVISFVHSIT